MERELEQEQERELEQEQEREQERELERELELEQERELRTMSLTVSILTREDVKLAVREHVSIELKPIYEILSRLVERINDLERIMQKRIEGMRGPENGNFKSPCPGGETIARCH